MKSRFVSRLLNQIRSNSLFFKMVLLVVLSVSGVSSFTLAIALRASEQVYVDALSQSGSQILAQIRENMLGYHDEAANVFSLVRSSWAFRSYLTGLNRNGAAASYTVYSMNKQLENTLPPDYFDKLGLIVAGINGTVYLSKNVSLTVPVRKLLDSPVTALSHEQPNHILYHFTEEGLTTLSRKGGCVMITTALCRAGTQIPYGYAYIVVPPPALRGFFESLSNRTNSLMLLSAEGQILSADDSALVGTRNPALLAAAERAEEELPYESLQLDGSQITVVARQVPRWDCHVLSVIDREMVLAAAGGQRSLIPLTAGLTLAVLLVMFFLLRKTTHPLHTLMERMRQVTEGDFSVTIPVQGSYEVRELAAAYNYMLDGLNSYVDRLVTAETEKRRAEIHALQMQIRPHFIYNTLTSIKCLVWQGDSEKAVRAIDAFSLLLRNTISNRGEMVTVAEEMDNLRRYVFLQHIRFGDQIQVVYSVEDGCERCLMPRLLLQPFVENAFFHAFSGRPDGFIHILLRRRGGSLVSEIIDNGTGIPSGQAARLPEESRKGDHFTGIGVANVNDRIKLLFGEGCGVTISSEPDSGTSVTVVIPALEGEPEKSTNS